MKLKFFCIGILSACLALPQEMPERGNTPPDAVGDQKIAPDNTRADTKSTESLLKDLQKKLEKLEKKYTKKKTELENRISQEKDAKKVEKLKKELAELETNFQKEKNDLNEKIGRLKIVPVEKRTVDTKSHLLVPGTCGDIMSWPPLDERRQMVEALGPPSRCEEHTSRDIVVWIGNATPLLSKSYCFTPITKGGQTGEFKFRAPGLTFMVFCNIEGTNCKMYVFMEHMPTLQQIVFVSGSDRQRDQLLLNMCPPNAQVEYPAQGLWHLLPLDANYGEEGNYDGVIRGLIDGMGGISRLHFGLQGLEAYKASAPIPKLELRNIVLDDKLPELFKSVENPWLAIYANFAPLLDEPTNDIFVQNKIADRLNFWLHGKVSVATAEEIKKFVEALDKKSVKTKNYEIYRHDLNEAESLFRAGKWKEAVKSMENLNKILEKDNKKIMKQCGKSLQARDRTVDFMEQWEFVPAGDVVSDFIKTHPDKKKQEEMKPLLATYNTNAKPVRDYIDKLRVKLTSNLKEGELLEPVVVKPGEKVVFLVSVVGGTIDYERQKTRLRAVVNERFVPADEVGVVEKDAPELNQLFAGMLNVDELIASGFESVVVEKSRSRTIVSQVQAKDRKIGFAKFADRANISEETVLLKDVKDKSGLSWLPVVMPKTNVSQSSIPKDPNKFLTTFSFLDRDSKRLTIMSFVFESRRPLTYVSPDGKGNAVTVNFYLYPGLYENEMTIVDALNKNVNDREVKFPKIRFRVLPPN